MVIPSKLTHLEGLLNLFHDSAAGGYSGVPRTYRCIAANYYWKGMKKTAGLC
uniref:Integrase zinc-binding domain-containing protein n=1 Tax=Nelumbo nucifera TaxID=4432 RepID=A0A822Y0E3_NELNU|nr:TPA_asm: hypothetical protein HUJ06_027395 [Nelumbo nucifera]